MYVAVLYNVMYVIDGSLTKCKHNNSDLANNNLFVGYATVSYSFIPVYTLLINLTLLTTRNVACLFLEQWNSEIFSSLFLASKSRKNEKS